LRQTTTIERLNVANRLPGDFVLVALLGMAVFVAVSGTSTITGGSLLFCLPLHRNSWELAGSFGILDHSQPELAGS